MNADEWAEKDWPWIIGSYPRVVEWIAKIQADARAGMVPEGEGHVQCDTCYQRGYVDGHRKARDTVGGLVAEDCRALDIDGGKCAKNQHHAPPHQNKEHAWYDAPRGLKDAYREGKVDGMFAERREREEKHEAELAKAWEAGKKATLEATAAFVPAVVWSSLSAKLQPPGGKAK